MKTPSAITMILQSVEEGVQPPVKTGSDFGNIPTLSDGNLLKRSTDRTKMVSVVTQVEQEREKLARMKVKDATSATVRSCGDSVAGLLSGMRGRVKRGFDNLWRAALSDRALSGSPMHIKAATLTQTLMPQGLPSTAQVTPAPGVYTGGEPLTFAQPQPAPGVQSGEQAQSVPGAQTGDPTSMPPKPRAGQGVQPTGLDAQPGQQAQKAVMPGVPGHAATNVIDRMGGLDPRGMTVDGNNAAGVPKGFKLASLGLGAGGGHWTVPEQVREWELSLMRALGQLPTPGDQSGGGEHCLQIKQATPGLNTGGSESQQLPTGEASGEPPSVGTNYDQMLQKLWERRDPDMIEADNPFRATPGPDTGDAQALLPGGLLKALGDDFDSYMKQAALGLSTGGGQRATPPKTVNRNQTPTPGDRTGEARGYTVKQAGVEPLPRWVSPPRKPLNQELLESDGVQQLLAALGMKSTPTGDIIDVAGNK